MSQACSQLLVQPEHRWRLNINDSRSLAVACIKGTVRITWSNDSRDIVIEAGQTFTLDKDGLALVAALIGQATIAVRQAGLRESFANSTPRPAKICDLQLRQSRRTAPRRAETTSE